MHAHVIAIAVFAIGFNMAMGQDVTLTDIRSLEETIKPETKNPGLSTTSPPNASPTASPTASLSASPTASLSASPTTSPTASPTFFVGESLIIPGFYSLDQSSVAGNNYPENAVDGDLTTFCESATPNVADSTWSMTFNEDVTIYKMIVSEPGANYINLFDRDGNELFRSYIIATERPYIYGPTYLLESPVEHVAEVRFTWFSSFSEIEVFGTIPTASPTTSPSPTSFFGESLIIPGFYSVDQSSVAGNNYPENALDGDITTFSESATPNSAESIWSITFDEDVSIYRILVKEVILEAGGVYMRLYDRGGNELRYFFIAATEQFDVGTHQSWNNFPVGGVAEIKIQWFYKFAEIEVYGTIPTASPTTSPTASPIPKVEIGTYKI